MAVRDRDSVFPSLRWVHLPEWVTRTPCTRCGGCGCGAEPPWLAEELRGLGGAEGGSGTAATGSWRCCADCQLIWARVLAAALFSFFSGNTWAGGFTCLLPAAGSYANAGYLSPRWAGPEEFSVAARAQQGMCGPGPGAPGLVGGRPRHPSFPGEARTG